GRGRDRGDAADHPGRHGVARPEGADPDDVRPGRVRDRGGAGGGERVPAEGLAAGGSGAGDPDSGGGRRDRGAERDAAAAGPVRVAAAGGAWRVAAAGAGYSDRPGARYAIAW